MIAYKFLSSGAVGLFSRHEWPTPADGAPGEWVRVDGEIRECLNGIHTCTKARLVDWLDDELWEIELDGPLVETDGQVIAPAGRLTRRLEAWNDESARAFIDYCVENAVSVAAESLMKSGLEGEAEALTAARSRPVAKRKVLELARSFEDEPTSPVVFVADVVRLRQGGRPELEEEAPALEAGGPTPSALAANLGFVCAYIVATLAEQESAGAYDESFARERLRQSAWLAEKLHLKR